MTSFTNKDIEFLSNPELIEIVRSVLEEIDLVAAAEAHRSTTYLAVSAIEGLFREILELRKIDSKAAGNAWPRDKNGKPRKASDLCLEQLETILRAVDALPNGLGELYGRARVFRNYMHPAVELKKGVPISRSTAQLSLACLNALIEEYGPRRYSANQTWCVEYGMAQVRADNVIMMPQCPSDYVSLLVGELPASGFRKAKFSVNIPPGAIFNFVYSFSGLDQSMAARIDGREGWGGRGLDNGLIRCNQWRNWSVVGQYTVDSEPRPTQLKHTVVATLCPSESFAIEVDGKRLELDRGTGWEYNPAGRFGFMTEHGPVSIENLEVYPI